MDRDQALAIVDEMLTDPNLKKHCLAVEAIMRGVGAALRGRRGRMGAGGPAA